MGEFSSLPLSASNPKEPGARTPDARRLIKDAFLHLYEQCPLKEISVERLAKEAGYSRAAFYRYFHSCSDVLNALEDDLLPTAQSGYVVEHSTSITPSVFIELYLDYFAHAQDALRIVLARDDRDDFYQKLSGTIFPAFYALFERKRAIAPEDLDRITAYLVECKMNQLRSWAHNPTQPLAQYMRMPLETVEKDFWESS